MTAYYNEIEPYAAQWLRNLIKEGLIPDGEVDTRSIVDVQPLDLRGFTQCHFFAGIGGWGLALRLAGWPDDRPIWTGSCPCQPFSVAGKGAGTDDPRHLWPHFHRLITANRPPVVMGEQVAGQAGYGWLDGVRADLAREGYTSRGVDIPACAVDAPHIRQRLYWVAADMAHTYGFHGECGQISQSGGVCSEKSKERSDDHLSGRDTFSDMGHTHDAGLEGHAGHGDGRKRRASKDGPTAQAGGGHMADAAGVRQQQRKHAGSVVCETTAQSEHEQISNADSPFGRGPASSFWSDHIWLTGADGKSRRSKPGLPLLAHGIPNRVGRLRAYGNAIVAQVAAEVIKAFMECES